MYVLKVQYIVEIIIIITNNLTHQTNLNVIVSHYFIIYVNLHTQMLSLNDLNLLSVYQINYSIVLSTVQNRLDYLTQEVQVVLLHIRNKTGMSLVKEEKHQTTDVVLCSYSSQPHKFTH